MQIDDHVVLNHCLFYVWPPPTTLAKHKTNSGSTSCIHWAANTNRHPDLEPAAVATSPYLLFPSILPIKYRTVHPNVHVCWSDADVCPVIHGPDTAFVVVVHTAVQA